MMIEFECDKNITRQNLKIGCESGWRLPGKQTVKESSKVLESWFMYSLGLIARQKRIL